MNDLTEYAVNLVSKTEYSNPLRYISGRIIEYDMRAANISCLAEANAISPEQYIFLLNAPKMEREIVIGKAIKTDPHLSTVIRSNIRIFKEELIKANQVQPGSIVRVANDAVYINNPIDLKQTKFGNYIEFKQKSIYNVYIKLNRLVIFSKLLGNGTADIDIKGINDNLAELHCPYMISAIVTAIMLTERSGISDGLNYISHIIEEYVNLRLPIGFYREFNSNSCYRMKQSTNYHSINSLGISILDESYKPLLDIQYNLSVLREFWSILVELYNRR